MWRVRGKHLSLDVITMIYHDVLPKNHQKSSWRHQEQTKHGRFSSIFLYELVPVSDAGCAQHPTIKSWGWSETLMLREAGTPQKNPGKTNTETSANVPSKANYARIDSDISLWFSSFFWWFEFPWYLSFPRDQDFQPGGRLEHLEVRPDALSTLGRLGSIPVDLAGVNHEYVGSYRDTHDEWWYPHNNHNTLDMNIMNQQKPTIWYGLVFSFSEHGGITRDFMATRRLGYWESTGSMLTIDVLPGGRTLFRTGQFPQSLGRNLEVTVSRFHDLYGVFDYFDWPPEPN